jgi:invasion protein IalB
MCVCGILLAYWNSWMLYCSLQNKELTNQAKNLQDKVQNTESKQPKLSLVLYAGRCSDKHIPFTKHKQ